MDDTRKQPGLAGNAIERTDNAYRGRKDGERLIGRDIPLDVQEWEEMSEDEREDAIRAGRRPPAGVRL